MSKLACLIPLASLCLMAQPVDSPISTAIKAQYNGVKNNLIRAAEKVPDSDYSFKPTDEVRSFGQIIGHVANANNRYCSMAAGEASPTSVNIEKEKTSKADLVLALKDSFAYCDKVHDGMTDAKGAEKVKMGRSEAPRLAILAANNSHDNEHYGNIVTYMRLKHLVPPSSEPRK